MRIRGYWGEFESPFLQARLISPSLNVNKRLDFLVDTGASRTVLLDGDARQIGVDYARLAKLSNGTVGIGGVVDTYAVHDAQLLFVGDTALCRIKLDDLLVLRHRPRNAEEERRIKRLPSVVGRDVLNRFEVVLNWKKRMIRLGPPTP